MTADVIAALEAVLKADAGVAALAGARVFGTELPAAESASMPLKAVVLRPSGGASLTGAGWAEHDTQRVDAFCYGETFDQAMRLDRAVHASLGALRRQVAAGVLLHWAQVAGGYLPFRDPDGDWPAVFRSWQVFFAEQGVAA